MFEDERRRQQQINREKAERYAVIVAVITQNAAAKRAREQQRALQQTKRGRRQGQVGAAALRAEPVEAQVCLPLDRLRSRLRYPTLRGMLPLCMACMPCTA
jgi:hypothetical protein